MVVNGEKRALLEAIKKPLICASTSARDESPAGDQTNHLFRSTITGAWETNLDKRLPTPDLYKGLDQHFHGVVLSTVYILVVHRLKCWANLVKEWFGRVHQNLFCLSAKL